MTGPNCYAWENFGWVEDLVALGFSIPLDTSAWEKCVPPTTLNELIALARQLTEEETDWKLIVNLKMFDPEFKDIELAGREQEAYDRYTKADRESKYLQAIRESNEQQLDPLEALKAEKKQLELDDWQESMREFHDRRKTCLQLIMSAEHMGDVNNNIEDLAEILGFEVEWSDEYDRFQFKGESNEQGPSQ